MQMLLAKLKEQLKLFQQSKINYFTMRIKDSEQDKKYTEQNREVVYQRAKFNLAYLGVLLLFSPLYLLVDRPSFFAVILIWLATFLILGITTTISKFRRVGTELILPMNILVRGLVMNFIMKQQKNLPCHSMLLEFTRRYIVHFFTISDLIVFRTNIFSVMLLSLPLFVIISGLNSHFDLSHPTGLCVDPVPLPVYYSRLLLYIPIVMPALFGTYLTGLNEQRLFIWSENNSKQQQTVLEIFER